MNACVENLIQRLNAKRSGSGWMAKCPAHDDGTPSLSISEGADGRVLLSCKAGCETPSVLAALNMKWSDLFPPKLAIVTNPISVKWASASDDGEAIKRLAAMSPIDYDRVRKAEAEKLGCQLSTLDKLVEAQRPKNNGGDKSLQGDAVVCPDVEPWPDPVNGAEVLNGISESITSYCAVPGGAADVVALFCAHTHCFELFRISPRLHITSPTQGCGKSTLRDVAALFVKRPLSAESLSTAVGFRVVAEEKPTLLADEIDRWLVNNDELCGFFNSNYKKGAVFLRCEGEDNKVRKFKAYSPAVICGIGALRGRLVTLHDRSIVIRLERAKPGELSLPFNEENTEKEHELTRKLARWIADNETLIAQCKPTLPAGVHNRLADNWRPLFAIAEVLGDEWRQRIFEAFAALNSKKLDVEALGIQLLRDIHDICKEHADDITDGWISSNDLIAHLKGKTESPWDEANKGGKPINARWLSVRLSEHDIKPDKLPGGHERGYQVASFQNAFDRYVLSVQASRQPVLRGKTTLTDSLTDRKTQVSSHSTRENQPSLTDRHIGGQEKPLAGKKAENDNDLPRLLVDLVNRLKAEINDGGLYPKGYVSPFTGKPDPYVNWSDNYPSEYISALDWIDCDRNNWTFSRTVLDPVRDAEGIEPQSPLRALSRLVYKIEAAEAKGQPLESKHRVWQEGSYPGEFLAARDYLRKQNELLAA